MFFYIQILNLITSSSASAEVSWHVDAGSIRHNLPSDGKDITSYQLMNEEGPKPVKTWTKKRVLRAEDIASYDDDDGTTVTDVESTTTKYETTGPTAYITNYERGTRIQHNIAREKYQSVDKEDVVTMRSHRKKKKTKHLREARIEHLQYTNKENTVRSGYHDNESETQSDQKENTLTQPFHDNEDIQPDGYHGNQETAFKGYSNKERTQSNFYRGETPSHNYFSRTKEPPSPQNHSNTKTSKSFRYNRNKQGSQSQRSHRTTENVLSLLNHDLTGDSHSIEEKQLSPWYQSNSEKAHLDHSKTEDTKQRYHSNEEKPLSPWYESNSEKATSHLNHGNIEDTEVRSPRYDCNQAKSPTLRSHGNTESDLSHPNDDDTEDTKQRHYDNEEKSLLQRSHKNKKRAPRLHSNYEDSKQRSYSKRSHHTRKRHVRHHAYKHTNKLERGITLPTFNDDDVIPKFTVQLTVPPRDSEKRETYTEPTEAEETTTESPKFVPVHEHHEDTKTTKHETESTTTHHHHHHEETTTATVSHHHHHHDEDTTTPHHHHHHDEDTTTPHHHHHDEETTTPHHHHHDEDTTTPHHHHHDEETTTPHHHHHDEETTTPHHHHPTNEATTTTHHNDGDTTPTLQDNHHDELTTTTLDPFDPANLPTDDFTTTTTQLTLDIVLDVETSTLKNTFDVIKNNTAEHVANIKDKFQGINDDINKFKNDTADQFAGVNDRAEAKVQDGLNELKNKTLGHINDIKNTFDNINKIKNETASHLSKLEDTASKLKNKTLDQISNIKDQFTTFKNKSLSPLDIFKNKESGVLVKNGRIVNRLQNSIDQLKNNTNVKYVSKMYDVVNTSKIDIQSLHKGLAGDILKVNNWKSRFSKVKDDKNINSFTKHILDHTLRIFDVVKKRSNEYYWKKHIKGIADTYEDKMTEYLRSTKQQQIKTRLGRQKVVLNTIDMSNIIVNRLINMIKIDMDKRGLRDKRTPKIIDREIKKELNWELKKACLELGICRTHSGFTELILQLLTTMVMLEDDKFRLAFDALTDAAKNQDFSQSLGKEVNQKLHDKLSEIDQQDFELKRPMIRIIQNIIANRHKPLVIYSDSDPIESNLNTTLSFLEIIDTLDAKVPESQSNHYEWKTIRTLMKAWEQGREIQQTMTRFIRHFKNVLDNLDGLSYKIIKQNAEILMA